MPIENFNLVSQLQIESHGVLDMYRSRFWETSEFDCNFEFGVFSFECPHGSDDDYTIKSLYHRVLKIRAKLPDGLRFAKNKVGPDQYHLSRWGAASSCLLKGPGGLSLQVLKLFSKAQQQQFLRNETTHANMLVSSQQESIALQPPQESPDMVLKLWVDKKVKRKIPGGVVGAQDAESSGQPPAAIEDDDDDDAPLIPARAQQRVALEAPPSIPAIVDAEVGSDDDVSEKDTLQKTVGLVEASTNEDDDMPTANGDNVDENVDEDFVTPEKKKKKTCTSIQTRTSTKNHPRPAQKLGPQNIKTNMLMLHLHLLLPQQILPLSPVQRLADLKTIQTRCIRSRRASVVISQSS